MRTADTASEYMIAEVRRIAEQFGYRIGSLRVGQVRNQGQAWRATKEMRFHIGQALRRKSALQELVHRQLQAYLRIEGARTSGLMPCQQSGGIQYQIENLIPGNSANFQVDLSRDIRQYP